MKVGSMILGLFVGLLCVAPAADASEKADTAPILKPFRTVNGQTVTSTSDPTVTITVPREAKYAGADRWILFGVADCEIHVFVEADARKRIQRVYWIQFEAYLPSKPNLRYSPKSMREEKLGDVTFRVRPRFGPTSDQPPPDSDAARVFGMLQQQGYLLPAHMMNTTAIHYSDDLRKELMIIVSEDMAPTGKTSDQLIEGNQPTKEWAAISEALVQRLKERVAVRPLKVNTAK